MATAFAEPAVADPSAVASIYGPSAMIPPSRLAHVVYRTSRFEEMVAWYAFVLNATPAFKNEGIAFLAYDDEHHRIAFLNQPGLKDRPDGTAEVNHVAFTYDKLSDLLDNHDRLRDAGIHPVLTINHGPTTSFYYADPDGHRIECQVDNYPTVDAAGEFFYSEAFAVNPIGVDIDPDDLRRRLAAGEEEQAVKMRPPSGPRDVTDLGGIG